ncbi:MAG: type II toxin-antitoxin system Phd/YefM family antitoxin [Synechococcus sp.]
MTTVRPLALVNSPRLVSKSQFKAHALALFREIEISGEAVVITDHGRPALEVRPYRPPEAGAPEALQALRGTVIRYDDPLEPVATDDWEALT